MPAFMSVAALPPLRGFGIQARINLETFQPDGSTIGTGGILSVYELPSGKGLRVDGFGCAGYRTNPAFDPLLAKLIVHQPSGAFADAVAKLKRALGEIRIRRVLSKGDVYRCMADWRVRRHGFGGFGETWLSGRTRRNFRPN